MGCNSLVDKRVADFAVLREVEADALLLLACADRGEGVGIYGGNIAEENEHEIFGADGKKKRIRTVDAWSVAASVGAAQHFLEERAFKEVLFRNGLPWVMVFDGLPGPGGKPQPEDGTIVVVGDIGDEFGHDCLLFPTARGLAEPRQKEELRKKLAALPADAPAKARQELEESIDRPQTLTDAALTLSDGSGFLRGPRFSLYDFYGNPVPSRSGKIVVPLDHRGFYLRANGGKGSFARLVEAVRAARIEGIEPLATVCHDLVSPVDKGTVLKLTLTTVLNRPVRGRLEVKLGALRVAPSLQEREFKGNETRIVELKVAGAPTPDNTYPLSLTFDAGRDGKAIHEENMHVNVIAKRTISVDGSLDDWKDVLPQIIVGPQKTMPTVTEAAWFPLRKFDESFKKGFAVGYLAHDARFFYFAAKIADDTPDTGMHRFETRKDDKYFYPEKCFKIDKDKDGKVTKRTELVWPEGVRRYTYRKEPELPSGNYPNHDNVQIAFNVLPPEAKPWYSHPLGTMPGYIAYLDTDYEYALNPVAEKYGGGVEIWRLLAPGMPRKHFYPRQPKCSFDGPVKDGRLVIRRDGNTRIAKRNARFRGEAPWSWPAKPLIRQVSPDA